MDITIKDPFGFILITLPVLIFAASILAELITKQRLIIIGVVFTASLIATFTVFNPSFLIWCVIYTILSFVGTQIGDLILRVRKKLA